MLEVNFMEDLKKILEVLKFFGNYDIQLYEAINVIEEVNKSTEKELIEWKNHLITNFRLTHLEQFTLDLIEKYKLT